MKGPDGVAERLSTVDLAITGTATLIAAPGAGNQICVFCVNGSATGAFQLQSPALTPVFAATPATGRPMMYRGEPLFVCPDNQILQLVAVGTLDVNIVYEIRPTGM